MFVRTKLLPGDDVWSTHRIYTPDGYYTPGHRFEVASIQSDGLWVTLLDYETEQELPGSYSAEWVTRERPLLVGVQE